MFAKLNGASIFFDVASSSLAVETNSLVEKPTIVALHGGLGFDHAYLKPGLEKLGEIAQIVFVDLRGQGRSARPPLANCTLEQMADDVAALCEHLGLERPIIFGHSAGGFVALHMALRYPDVVGGLILCDTSPAMAPLPDDEGDPAPSFPSRGDAEALAVATRIFSGEITDETVSLFLRHVAPFYAAPEHMSVVADLLALTTVDIPMMQHFMHSIAPSYDLRTEVGKIRAPALVMVGRHDWVCPPRASRFLARTMPHATLIEFGDSGHFPFSEVPKRFFEEVSSFLKAHANGRSPQ